MPYKINFIGIKKEYILLKKRKDFVSFIFFHHINFSAFSTLSNFIVKNEELPSGSR